MSDEPKIAALDVAEIERWLIEPGAPLGELMKQLPFLRTEAQARRFLEDIKEGLEDVKAGRTVSHEDLLAHRAEQRRRWLAERKS